MNWQTLTAALFPQGCDVREEHQVLTGGGTVGSDTVAVVGTTGHVPIGVETALAQARFVLETVRAHPGRPTSGARANGGTRSTPGRS